MPNKSFLPKGTCPYMKNRFRKSPSSDLAMPELTPEMLQSYRTRGWLLPLCGFLTALVFCLTLPEWYGMGTDNLPPEVSLLLGIFLSIIAVPFHILAGSRKRLRGWESKHLLYWVSIGLNALGSSLSMAAYYLFAELEPVSGVLYAAIVLPVAVYAITAVLMQLWPHRYALITGLVALLTLVLLILSAVFWVKNNNKLFFSFVFFNMLWLLISVIALHAACTDEGAPGLRFASFASFGILMGVAAIVLVILACAGGDCDCDCDCDGCDGCNGCDCGDCGLGGGESRTAKRRKTKFKKNP